MSKKANRKSKTWFKRVRGSYLPNSTAGWLTYIPYVAYTVGVLIFVLHQDYDLWLSLFIVIPNWVAAVAVMNWIAAKTS